MEKELYEKEWRPSNLIEIMSNKASVFRKEKPKKVPRFFYRVPGLDLIIANSYSQCSLQGSLKRRSPFDKLKTFEQESSLRNKKIKKIVSHPEDDFKRSLLLFMKKIQIDFLALEAPDIVFF